MNAHEQSCNDCKLGIKAYQNLVGSLQAIDQFSALTPTGDHIILSSVFCFAIVKYAKPFVETKTSCGKRKTRYPVGQLKKIQGFSIEMHSHLLELRNTLVAHDDLESIEPKILELCLSISGSDFKIPTSIAISNKCLSYPAVGESIIKMREHIASCAQGVLDKIHTDLAKVREARLQYPEQANEGARYQKHYGQTHIAEGGSRLQPPDLMGNEWLNINAPNFRHIYNGLLYEELRVRRDFHGPERIKLPDGCEISISPPNTKAPGC